MYDRQSELSLSRRFVEGGYLERANDSRLTGERIVTKMRGTTTSRLVSMTMTRLSGVDAKHVRLNFPASGSSKKTGDFMARYTAKGIMWSRLVSCQEHRTGHSSAGDDALSRTGLLDVSAASYIPTIMLTHNGSIAVPDKDPKTRRSRGRKKRKYPAVPSAIVTLRRRCHGPGAPALRRSADHG
jgi:hypothetical protein